VNRDAQSVDEAIEICIPAGDDFLSIFLIAWNPASRRCAVAAGFLHGWQRGIGGSNPLLQARREADR
jgi:hypothetical protein